MKFYIKIFLGFNFLLTSILFLSCGDNNNSVEHIATGTSVKIASPLKMDISEYITLNAKTMFLNKEVVRAAFQGFIEKTYKNIGDKVTAGDDLFVIKTKEFAGDKATKIPIGENTFTGSINIKSKTSGVLTELNFNMGDYVSDGDQLAVISNPNSLRISLDVPYQYTDQLKLNSKCEIILPNEKTVGAVIQKIIPKVDINAQTQTYILNLIQTESLPENLNVSAKIPIKSFKDALVVPKSAVLANETLDKFWIMKLINDSTAVRVDVEKGIENNSNIQIVKPILKESDRVIIDGAFGLPDTSKIVINQ